jgi:hypothetical protein
MKKFVAILSLFCLFSQTGLAKDVEHKVKSAAQKQAVQSDSKLGWTRAKFTLCNKTSMPLFFVAWAIDTWEPKPYRWNDWIMTGECRTDKFDKFFNVTLYELSTGPGEALLLDHVLREGKTVNITESYLAKHAK